MKGSRTKSFFSEALARGSPRKGSSTSLLFPGNAFQKLWPGGPPRKSSRTRFSLPGKTLEQDSYYQEMPSRGSGHGVPQERHQKKIVFTRKCVPEALAGDPAREKLQNKIVITWKCLPEAWPGSPPRNGSRTRSFLPGNAFQRLWPRCPPGKALEQDRYYQEVPSRGSGQRVVAGRRGEPERRP